MTLIPPEQMHEVAVKMQYNTNSDEKKHDILMAMYRFKDEQDDPRILEMAKQQITWYTECLLGQ